MMQRMDLMANYNSAVESAYTDRYSDFVSPEIRVREAPINNFLYAEF